MGDIIGDWGNRNQYPKTKNYIFDWGNRWGWFPIVGRARGYFWLSPPPSPNQSQCPPWNTPLHLKLNIQAWKFGGINLFVTTSFLLLIKDGNDNLFPQIHLHNTNAFFEDLTRKHFYDLAYKLHFLHTDLPMLHKWACFSTTLLPLSIYLECSP